MFASDLMTCPKIPLPSKSKCVLTIAAGKQIYYEFAANLARSFRIHHSNTDIDFVMAVDDPEKVPSDVTAWAEVVAIPESIADVGFELKLHLDQYSDYQKTLFIDADCLVVESLEEVFVRFAGQDFVALGQDLSSGEWFGDISERLQEIARPSLPVFVGAIYYFDRNPRGLAVLKIARELACQYDELGLVRLRGKKNEEPLLSLAMSRCGIPAQMDAGDIKCDYMAFDGPIRVDVVRSVAQFNNPLRDFLLVPKGGQRLTPKIAHFNDAYAGTWLYLRESDRLRLNQAYRVPTPLARFIPILTREWPGRMMITTKRLLRPVYHKLFGLRRVTRNDRV